MAIEINHAGKSTLVTGGGAGIGKEIALWMARAGSNVAIIEKRAEQAEAVCEEIGILGVKAYAILGDARNDKELISMVEESASKLGGLDFAVNNIGMLGGKGSSNWLEMTTEQIRDVVEQNLVLTAIACQAESKLMSNDNENSEDRVILNVSSGETTRPAIGLAGYGAAKAGINHLTQTLAAELGVHNIRVNAMAPGTTMTEQVSQAYSEEQYQAFVKSTPLKRETLAEELGRLAVFLTSDLARCITGQLFLADAGAYLSRTRPLS